MRMRRTIVRVMVAGTAVLDLERGVVDAEFVVQVVRQQIDEGIVIVVAGTHQVRGHGDLAGAQRPDMEVVDGNDAEAVYAVTVEARARALAGSGPTLIECKTYRWRGHGEADHQLYQPREEIEAWQRRCPLALARERLLAAGLLDQARVAALEAEVAATVQAAVRFAEDSPYPEPPEALEDVFA